MSPPDGLTQEDEMRLFLLFLAVPLIEIALFVQVGGLIGLPATLLIVVLTAVAGTLLIRSQGTAVMLQLRETMNDLRDPTEPLAHGAMVLFAGALLFTPGFFTDVLGLSLMVPGIRSRIFNFVRSRITVQEFHYGKTMDASETVIDADYEDLDQPKGPSGWTRH